MYYMIGWHKVQDFDKFKAEFEAAADMLRQAGILRAWINRNVDDHTEVTTVLECDDVEKCRQLAQSKEYMECAARGGTIGKSHSMFVEEVAKMPELANR